VLVRYPAKKSYQNLNEVIVGIKLGFSEVFSGDLLLLPFKPPLGLNWAKVRHNIKCFQKSHPKYRRRVRGIDVEHSSKEIKNKQKNPI